MFDHPVLGLGRALTSLPESMREQTRRIWYEGSEEEFWEFYDWIMGLPELPRERSAVEYIRRQYRYYWDDDEIIEMLGR